MSSFDLGGVVNNISGWLYAAPVVKNVINNPIFTALLLTAIVAIIGISIYRAQIKEAGNTKALRAVLYIFLSAMAILFVHHYAVVRTYNDLNQKTGIRDVFSSIQQSIAVGGQDNIPIFPNIDNKITGGNEISSRPDNIMTPDLQINDVVMATGIFR